MVSRSRFTNTSFINYLETEFQPYVDDGVHDETVGELVASRTGCDATTSQRGRRATRDS